MYMHTINLNIIWCQFFLKRIDKTEEYQILQVQKGADLIQPSAAGGKTNLSSDGKNGSEEREERKNRGGINQSLRRYINKLPRGCVSKKSVKGKKKNTPQNSEPRTRF